MTKTYRVASILYPSGNSSLDSISTDIFFYGCSNNCKGCHNLELQQFKQPNLSLEDILSTVKLADRANIVTLMGGEPLQQDKDSILVLIEQLHNMGKKVAVYTGYDMDEVDKDILDNIEYIKVGKYDETNKAPYGFFLATKNQKMYKKTTEGDWKIQWEYYAGRKSKY